MADEVQRLALVRALAPRIAALELDALRLVDHIVTRLELGRERYGELDLAAPRDWGKELGEELVDALVYQAARELAAQDRAREQLREAARAEMVGGAAFAELVNRECDAAIAAADRREAELDAHGYGGPADGIHVRARSVANYAAPLTASFITPAARTDMIIAAVQDGRITAEVGRELLDEPELGGEG